MITKKSIRQMINEAMDDLTQSNTPIELLNDKNCKPRRPGEPYNRPVKIDGQLFYISRSITVSLYVYCKNKEGELCVLANQRGQGAQNANMLWNIPAGYLDYGESIEQAAQREAYEETGVVVPLEKIEMMGINSSPGGRRQDVSVRFSAVLDGTIDDYPVDISHCEPGEVADAGWIPLSGIGSKRWAYGQHHKIVPQAETMFGNLDSYNKNGNDLSNMIAELKHELSGNPKAKYLFNKIIKLIKKQNAGI